MRRRCSRSSVGAVARETSAPRSRSPSELRQFPVAAPHPRDHSGAMTGPGRRLRALLLLSLLASACDVETSPLDVVLVTLDTLRADRLSLYGAGAAQTPNLEWLASQGVVFENAYSPIPATLPSHASILTGAYPKELGIHDNGLYRLDESRVTLAERLHQAGYATAAFVSAFVLDSRFRLDQGFELYDDEMDFPIQPPLRISGDPQDAFDRQLAAPSQRRASVVTDRALAWLEEAHRRPFFLWVHYFDAHQPYQAPEPFTTLYDPDYQGPLDGDARTWWYVLVRYWSRNRNRSGYPKRDHAHMIARYDGEIAYLDSELGRLFDSLRRNDRWSHTIVTVVADHGESFGDHGIHFWNHNGSLHEEVLRVPLLVRIPKRGVPGTRVSALVRSFDVTPTILDALDLPALEAVGGRSLLPFIDDPSHHDERHLIAEAGQDRQLRTPLRGPQLALHTMGEKLIIELDAAGNVVRRRYYRTSTDRNEAQPLRDPASTERAFELQQRLLESYRALGGESARVAPDLLESDREKLRALGYLTE